MEESCYYCCPGTGSLRKGGREGEGSEVKKKERGGRGRREGKRERGMDKRGETESIYNSSCLHFPCVSDSIK